MVENKVERQPLDEYDSELLREVVHGILINMGFGRKNDNRKFRETISSRLSAQITGASLLQLGYLMGYNDALSRSIYGGGCYEINAIGVKTIREDIEDKFQTHRQRQNQEEGERKV